MLNKWLNKRKNFGLVAVALALVLALVATTCTPAKPVEKVVKIGHQCVLTGALASTGVPEAYGTFDYGKWLNEQGGLDGYPVKVIWYDSAYIIPRMITIHKRYKEAGIVAETSITSGALETLKEVLVKDEIPGIYVGGISPAMWTEPVPWIFGSSPGFANEFPMFMRWVKENWTEGRPPRVGILFFDQMAGWSTLEGAEFANRVGVDFVGYEVIPVFGVIDTTTELLRLSKKNPDWVFFSVWGAGLVTVVMDTQRLEFQKKGIKLHGASLTLDEVILGAVGDAAEGWFFHRPYPTNVETEIPGMDTIFEAAKKYRGYDSDKVPGNYIAGWIRTAVVFEGVRLAIQRVGLENLNGRAVRDVLASMKDVDIGFIPPINTSENTPCFGTVRVYHIEQGRLVPTSGWLEPIYWAWEEKK